MKVAAAAANRGSFQQAAGPKPKAQHQKDLANRLAQPIERKYRGSTASLQEPGPAAQAKKPQQASTASLGGIEVINVKAGGVR